MTAILLLEWVGTLALMLGSIYLVKRKKICFVFYLVQNMAMIPFAVYYHFWAILLVQCYFVAVNAWGYYNWSKR